MAAQFDIANNLNAAGRASYPYLLILQHDRVESLQSVIVAPLVRAVSGAGRSRLHPKIDVMGHPYIVKMEDIAAIPRGTIGAVVGSAEASRYEIIAALDLIFTGY